MIAREYPNGEAPLSALHFIENMYLDDDMAPRIVTAFRNIRARGESIVGNQGYRTLGQPSDRAIGARGGNESETSDRTGNQWYQLGRQDAGLTPSAAWPGTSNHGLGLSVDTDCSSIEVRDDEFALVGLTRDISSETWHATIYRDPVIELDSLGATTAVTPSKPKETRMSQGIVFAHQNDAWFIGDRDTGTYQYIEPGMGGAYLKATGQESPVSLLDSEVPTVMAWCLGGSRTDTKVYAVADGPSKDVWLALGPAIDYVIPAGQGDVWTAQFGDRIPVTDAALVELRRGFASGRTA